MDNKIQTRFGHFLTEHERRAWTTIKRVIEDDERMSGDRDHGMADSFRSYFKEIEVVHDGFALAELKNAFDIVADPDDWRAPIDHVINSKIKDMVVAAIVHFTGAEVDIKCAEGRNVVRVISPGYRLGPCGP